MDHKEGCLICGKPLVYTDQSEKRKCVFCGEEKSSTSICSEGHFVCDTCHGADGIDVITMFCLNSDETDPMAMALQLMRHPSIHLHGPEHHYLVPAVLITAYLNKKGMKKEKKAYLEETQKRSANIPGGACGLMGVCGTGVGTGIFVSLVTKSTPLSKDEWELTGQMAVQALGKIAGAGGPRCCKRTSYIAIENAMEFIRFQGLGDLGVPTTVKCSYSKLNKECQYTDCRFFNPEKEKSYIPKKDDSCCC